MGYFDRLKATENVSLNFLIAVCEALKDLHLKYFKNMYGATKYFNSLKSFNLSQKRFGLIFIIIFC